MLVPPVFERSRPHYGQKAQVDQPAQKDQRWRPREVGAIGEEKDVCPHACIQHGGPRAYLAGPQDWLPACGPAGSGGLRRIQSGGQVSGQGGQFGVGPRRQRLAHPQVELVHGQHSLHERGLEHADHLLAVGVRGAQVTAVSRPYCHFISRIYVHGTSPAREARKRDAAAREPAIHRPRRHQDCPLDPPEEPSPVLDPASIAVFHAIFVPSGFGGVRHRWLHSSRPLECVTTFAFSEGFSISRSRITSPGQGDVKAAPCHRTQGAGQSGDVVTLWYIARYGQLITIW
jgi:hypothetical protein